MRDGETVPVSVPLAIRGDPKHNIRVRAGDQRDAAGEITDVEASYPCDLQTQMLEWSGRR